MSEPGEIYLHAEMKMVPGLEGKADVSSRIRGKKGELLTLLSALIDHLAGGIGTTYSMPCIAMLARGQNKSEETVRMDLSKIEKEDQP